MSRERPSLPVTQVLAPLSSEQRGPSLTAPPVSPPTEERAARQATVIRPLFRASAVSAQAVAAEPRDPLDVAPPWTWVTILSGLAVLMAGVAASIVTHVEISSTGRGILQASGPPQVLMSRAEGRVVAVLAKAGDSVSAGQELIRLESTSTSANLVEIERSVEIAERALKEFLEHRRPLYARRGEQLAIQVAVLERRMSSDRSSVARMARRAQRFGELGREGLASALDVDSAREAISTASREALRTEEECARIRDQIAVVELESASEEERLVQAVEVAKARRESAGVSAQASVARAPSDGVMGAVVVRVGDVVMNGTPLGRVVPNGEPQQVVAYVPERDRAFLKIGSLVRVELDQLPAWEFGALRGRIIAVGREIASGAELQSTFGDRVQLEEPLYRVEVALETGDARYRELRPRLRAESLASVRFILRERRVITVLLEPLKRWLE